MHEQGQRASFRISKRLVLAMAAAALAGLGGGIAVVGAHDVVHPAGTIGYFTATADPGDRYKVQGDIGMVQKCQPDRTVRFLRERTGDDKLKGTDVSDGAGEFKFVFPNGLKSAMYYLKVARRVLRASSDHRHICQAAKTSPFAAGNNP